MRIFKHSNIELFTIVYDESISGLGSLCVYDTSLRFGAIFNIYPEVFFLHRGALVGAKNLLGLNTLNTIIIYYNEDSRFPYILKEDLPEVLHSLNAYHLENFFCRFKNRLNNC